MSCFVDNHQQEVERIDKQDETRTDRDAVHDTIIMPEIRHRKAVR